MPIDVYKEWLGIPEGPRPPDYYALLRLVQFEDDVDKIRKNYKKLNGHVRKYATGDYSDESQDLLNELAKAMLCLTDAERKQEYDRSQGREIDDRDQSTGRRPLTSYLLDQGVLTAEQVQSVKTHAERTGLSTRDSVVQLKLADAETVARAWASELGLSYVDLADMLPDDTVLDQVPKTLVRRYSCLPLFVDDDRVLIACANEPDHELEDEIRLRFGLPMRAVVATPLAINQAIAKYYAPGARNESAAIDTSKKGGKKSAGKSTTSQAPARLSKEEKAEQKQMGILICCWIFIGCSLLDNFLLYDKLWKFIPFVPSAFPMVLTGFVGVP
ncbi:MAG TPA: hypothetical protein VL132_11805, partial [Planctomycetaceae bacterium]|nr:hypothetical protein [Planctomycetaceae bacterium]